MFTEYYICYVLVDYEISTGWLVYGRLGFIEKCDSQIFILIKLCSLYLLKNNPSRMFK